MKPAARSAPAPKPGRFARLLNGPEQTDPLCLTNQSFGRKAHQIIQTVIVFDLADPSNSDLGGVTVTELNPAPGAARNFKKPIEQTNAMYALVREVETR
jgi:hypothetical protein